KSMLSFQVDPISAIDSKKDPSSNTWAIRRPVLISRNVLELILLTVNTWKNKNKQVMNQGMTFVNFQENSLQPRNKRTRSARNTQANNAGHLVFMCRIYIFYGKYAYIVYLVHIVLPRIKS